MKGDVVIVPFPYSDLSLTKRRPAVVISVLSSGDVILCQITSKAVSDGEAVALDSADFATRSLTLPSNIRPNKLFTADSQIVLYKAGTLKSGKLTETVNKIVEVVQR